MQREREGQTRKWVCGDRDEYGKIGKQAIKEGGLYLDKEKEDIVEIDRTANERENRGVERERERVLSLLSCFLCEKILTKAKGEKAHIIRAKIKT